MEISGYRGLRATYREMEDYGIISKVCGEEIQLPDGRIVPSIINASIETPDRTLTLRAVYEGAKTLAENKIRKAVTLADYALESADIPTTLMKSSGGDLGNLIFKLTGKFPDGNNDYYGAGVDF